MASQNPDDQDIHPVRKHARLKTREHARISIGDDEQHLCEIRDFSQSGLQVIGLDGLDVPATSLNQHVEIDFPLHGENAGAFKLSGELVHTSGAGVGLKLDDMTHEAFQALVTARTRIAGNSTPASGLLPEESQAMLRDSIRLFHLFLEHSWHRFLDDIAIKVAERDTASLPLVDQSRYLAALTGLLQRGGDISRAHYVSVVRQMRHIAEPRKSPDRLDFDETELSIVDDERFEDWLNIAQIFNRIEADHRGAMFQFEQRFSRLAPALIDRHNDPFGPEAVCLAFQEALKQLDVNNAMRVMIYKSFGKALEIGYGDLYAKLNELLAPLKPVRPPRMPTHENMQVDSAQGEDHTAYALDDPPSPQVGTPSLRDISAQVSQLTEIASKLFAIPPDTLASAGMRTESGTTASVDPGRSGVNQETFQILRRTLEQLSAQKNPDAPRLSAATEPALGDHDYRSAPSLDELLDPSAQAPSLTNWMFSLLAQGKTGRLAAPQRQALGMTANLMGQALAEHAVQSDLDSLLKKLEKPLYERVLRGEDPLNQPDHPLRRLFDLIDRFAIVTDDQGQFLDKDLGDLLNTVIDHALAKVDSDPRSFENANEALEKLLKHSSRAHRQRLIEHQELCEAQELIRSAKLQVADQLDHLLAGRSVPRAVVTLLEAGLRQDLVLNTLRGQQEARRDAYKLLGALLEGGASASPEAFLRETEQRLNLVNTDQRQIEQCLGALRTHLAAPDTGETVQLAEHWFRHDTGLAGQHDHPATDAGDLPSRQGEWWDFDNEGRTVPMQLVWANQQTGNYGFVNRSATHNIQVTRAKLAKRLASGTLRRGENRDLPLMDRAANGAVDTLYRQLAHRAHHDPVTQLLNRKGLMYAAARKPNTSDKGHVIGMLEFVPFRAIVDACGMEAGERLTQELVAIVQRRIGATDALASVGDGRLAFLFANMDTTGAQRIADALTQSLAGFMFRHEDAHYAVEARIGLAGLSPGTTEPQEALRRAATACVAAVNGGAAIQVYENPGEQLREQETLRAWGRRLDTLLAEDGGLFLRCQRIAPLREDDTVLPYYEILLGVRDESGQVVSPQPFVEATEYWKRTRDLDLWVIEHAFAWMRRHPDDFARTGGFSINLSALSMADAIILDRLHEHLGRSDLDTGKIIFEITETATVSNYDQARDFIRQIREYGCKFCIDDFGSGNASYGYLRNLKTDTLKIDGAFVKDMVGDPDLQAMVKSMNDIGHSLGMKTVAEFVANEDILTLAREIGVDYAQGYIVEKPRPLDELAQF